MCTRSQAMESGRIITRLLVRLEDVLDYCVVILYCDFELIVHVSSQVTRV
jgi:hypothetical protein